MLLFSLHYEREPFIVLWVFAVLTRTPNYLFHVFQLTISVSDIYIMVSKRFNVGIVANC